MKTKILYWLAIALIIETGLLHFVTAQHEFEEAAYLGYLFIFNFLGALLAAYGIYRRQMWGWWLGFFVAAGSIAGYIWSRTLGLPGMEVDEWLFPSGVLSVAIEALFLLVMLTRPWKMADDAAVISLPSLFHHLLPATIMVGMVLITGYANISINSSGDTHHEVASVEQLSRMLPISSDELEQRYGMRVTQVAISALDAIVDVRVKVLDPDKAHTLLENSAALFVDGQSVILAPHMHTHAKLKPGQIYVMFFPTQNRTVHPGSEVSLVLGDLRVEPVTTK
jgi:hypothetical protein